MNYFKYFMNNSIYKSRHRYNTFYLHHKIQHFVLVIFTIFSFLWITLIFYSLFFQILFLFYKNIGNTIFHDRIKITSAKINNITLVLILTINPDITIIPSIMI